MFPHRLGLWLKRLLPASARRRSSRFFRPRLEELEPRRTPVTSAADSGAGSLRQAILDANANPGVDMIQFNIPTTDPGFDPATGSFSIRLTSALPGITDPVTIDGTTQPGFAGR